ncbi:hypothetical protein FRC17_010794, partial [Serendipita sp. 399]
SFHQLLFGVLPARNHSMSKAYLSPMSKTFIQMQHWISPSFTLTGNQCFRLPLISVH